MVKNDLRERDYYSVEKIQRTGIITIIWVVLTVSIIALTIVGVFLTSDRSQGDDSKGGNFLAFIDESAMLLLIALVLVIIGGSKVFGNSR